MATDTGHARVRPGEIGGVLRSHDRVTSFATEGHRLCIFKRAITTKSAGTDKEKSDPEKYKEAGTRAGIVEVERRVPGNLFGCAAMTPAPFKYYSHDDDQQTKDQNGRKEDVRQNTQVGILFMGSYF